MQIDEESGYLEESTPKQAAQYSAKAELQTGCQVESPTLISSTGDERSTAFNTHAVTSSYDDLSALGDENEAEEMKDLGSMPPLEGHNWKGLTWPE